MTRLVIELAPGRFVKPTPKVEAAWDAYRRHCPARPRDSGWEAERTRLYGLFRKASDE